MDADNRARAGVDVHVNLVIDTEVAQVALGVTGMLVAVWVLGIRNAVEPLFKRRPVEERSEL